MSTAKRHTLFLDDAVSDEKVELVVAKAKPALPIGHPPTGRMLKRRRAIGQETQDDIGSTAAKPVLSSLLLSSTSTQSRFPVKHTSHSSNKASLVPVL